MKKNIARLGAILNLKSYLDLVGEIATTHIKKTKKRFNVNPCSLIRKDFSQLKYYDEYREKKGNKAYKNYVDRNHSIDNL